MNRITHEYLRAQGIAVAYQQTYEGDLIIPKGVLEQFGLVTSAVYSTIFRPLRENGNQFTPISVKEIADAVGVSQNTVSKAIKHLEEDGAIETMYAGLPRRKYYRISEGGE